MAAMFLGAFGAGYFPLAFNLSEGRLRVITIFGAGLLVGTALAVIIPEGIAMHYASQLQQHDAHGRHLLADAHAHGEDEEITHSHPGHWQIGASLAFGFAFQLVVGEHLDSRAP
jgi:zinc transporter 9